MTTAPTSKTKSKPPAASAAKKKTSPAPKKKLTRQKTEGSNMATVGDAEPEFFDVPCDADELAAPDTGVSLTFSEGQYLADGEPFPGDTVRVEDGVAVDAATGAIVGQVQYVGEQLPESPGTYSVQEHCNGDGWSAARGDCVEVMRTMPERSVHLTVTSVPFGSLFTYSNSDRDMGNVKSDAEFFEQFGFWVRELLRVTMPGRIAAIHCMLLPSSKTRDGFIGLKDFRGNVVRAMQNGGWIFHSETAIRKDPVVAVQRTKALGLLRSTLRALATDGKRAHVASETLATVPPALAPMMLPLACVDALLAILDGKGDIVVGASPDSQEFGVKAGEVVFTTKSVAAEFPPVMGWFLEMGPVEFSVAREQFTDSLRSVALSTPDGDLAGKVSLSVDGDEVGLAGDGKGAASDSFTLAEPATGQLAVDFFAPYMIDAMAQTETVRIAAGPTELSPVYVIGPKLTAVVMPCRR